MKAMNAPVRHADLFDRWYVTEPPGADYHVLMCGSRVMAQGSMDTLRLHRNYSLTTIAT